MAAAEFPLIPMPYPNEEQVVEPKAENACAYVILDRNIEANSKADLLKRVIWVGQTICTTRQRLRIHKCRRPEKMNNAKLIVVRDNSGANDAEEDSLMYEYLIFAHHNHFPNLISECKPGNFHDESIARKSIAAKRRAVTADPGLQQEVIECLAAALTREWNGEQEADFDEIYDKKFMNCQICGKHFVVRADLEFHVKTHSTIITHEFTCGECGREYASGNSLARHLWEAHGKGKKRSYIREKKRVLKKVNCPECGIELSQFSQLKRHLLAVHKWSQDKVDDFHAKSKRQHLRPHAKTMRKKAEESKLAEQSAMREWLGGGTKRRRLEVPTTGNNENTNDLAESHRSYTLNGNQQGEQCHEQELIILSDEDEIQEDGLDEAIDDTTSEYGGNVNNWMDLPGTSSSSQNG